MDGYKDRSYQPAADHDIVVLVHLTRLVTCKVIFFIAGPTIFFIKGVPWFIGLAALVFCWVGMLAGDFPAFTCCPECRKKMEHDGRWLVCHHCRRFVEFEPARRHVAYRSWSGKKEKRAEEEAAAHRERTAGTEPIKPPVTRSGSEE